MSVVFTEDELDELEKFVAKLKSGEIIDPAFTIQPEEKINDPKNWKELYDNIQKLPSDDPLTWVKLSKCGKYLMNPLWLPEKGFAGIEF